MATRGAAPRWRAPCRAGDRPLFISVAILRKLPSSAGAFATISVSRPRQLPGQLARLTLAETRRRRAIQVGTHSLSVLPRDSVRRFFDCAALATSARRTPTYDGRADAIEPDERVPLTQGDETIVCSVG